MTATDFLVGGGVTGARMRRHDWSASAVGLPDTWPHPLRTALSFMLQSSFPACLAWGPELVTFYNDAYLPLLGSRPASLGCSIHEFWREGWNELRPIVARALAGQASCREDLPLTLERNGRPEKTWWTFLCSPTSNEGGVGGMLCIVHETTRRVLTQRRLRFLDDLSDRMRGLSDLRKVMAVAAERLGGHLEAGRAGYGEVDATGTVLTVERDWTDGAMPSFVGRHRLDDYGLPLMNELKTGRTIRLDDVLTDARTAGETVAAAYAASGMRAGIAAPFAQGGRTAAALYVHQAEPRCWGDDELALIDEVASRVSEAVRRARSETALREREARLEAAVDLAGLSHYMWEPGTGDFHCDDRLRTMWGLAPGSHVDVDVLLAAIHREDRPHVEAAIDRCFDPAEDGDYEIECRVIGRDDRMERWVSTRGRAIHGQHQSVRLVGTVLDITERRQAEKRRRKSEERLSEYAEHSANLLWIFDAEMNRLEYVSPACEQVWGESHDVLVADWNRWNERLHPDDRQHMLDVFERVLGGVTTTCEYRIVRGDGSVRWIRDTLFPIPDQYGRVRRAAGLAQNITRRQEGTVYVIEGHGAALRASAGMLQRAGYEVKIFASERAFLDAAPVLVPGCAVLEVGAHDARGLGVARELKARHIGLPVIATGTRRGDVGLAVQAMKAGVFDYLEAPCTAEALLVAVTSALTGTQESMKRDHSAEDARARVARLSARERQVLDGLLAGGTNKTIGKKLGISPRTVEIHRAHVMDRLGAQTLPELVLKVAAGLEPSRAVGLGNPNRNP